MESIACTVKTGRPCFFTERDRTHFIRIFLCMREENRNVTVLQVGREAGMTHVSCRTLIRTLNEAKYYKLTARRKGVLSADDRLKRVKFVGEAIKKYDSCFWGDDVLLYLDGITLIHKSNPYREAVSAQGKVYRQKNKGLKIASRGSKNLPGRKRIHFLVGISAGFCLSLIEENTKMEGHYFAKFVQKTLHRKLLELADMKGREKLVFVMDNDPSQTSKVALDAVDECGIQFLNIPPTSPDINPIQNMFHNIRLALRKEAMEKKICKETYAEFKQRIMKIAIYH